MGKRGIRDTHGPDWALSQVSRKIRVSFEASKEERQRELAEDLAAAIYDDEEFEILHSLDARNFIEKISTDPDSRRSITDPGAADGGGTEESTDVVAEDDDDDDNMEDGHVTVASTKISKSQQKSNDHHDEGADDDDNVVSQKKVKKGRSGRKPTWRIRISKLIGTYDSFLDVPEDLFDPESWNARPRPDGYRSLLVRNRRENVCIVGKGGLELWSLKTHQQPSRMETWQILECIPENTILEGFWNADLKHFYVFDLLVWNSMDMISCDFQSRHFLLRSKWEEYLLKTELVSNDYIPSVRFLMVQPISLTEDDLRSLYDHVARSNLMTTPPPYAAQCTDETSCGNFGVMSPLTLEYPYTKYDGIIFTHNNSIYTPAINPFTLHWRHPDLSIWISETKKRYPKGCLIYSTLTQTFKTCDDTECRLLDCVFPVDFTTKASKSKQCNLLVRVSYDWIDLVNKPSGETMIQIHGAKIEKWRLDSETKKSWRWNGADSFSRLILDMPLYDQLGEKVDTASPDIEEVLRRAKAYNDCDDKL